jgi:hypothetical protein
MQIRQNSSLPASDCTRCLVAGDEGLRGNHGTPPQQRGRYERAVLIEQGPFECAG